MPAPSSASLLDEHGAGGVARAEGADQAGVPGEAGVVLWKAMIEPADQVLAYSSRMVGVSPGADRGPAPSARSFVHVDVGLVQPEALQARGSSPRSPMRDDHVGDHRHDLLEHLAALLDEQLVGLADPSGAARLRKPKLLRMLLENLVFSRVQTISQLLRAVRARRARRPRRCHVAEDEVAVAVAEVQVARADLRIDTRTARASPRPRSRPRP